MDKPPFDRKRKTKDPCRVCYLHKDLCLCALLPSLSLQTKVSLVIHKRELKRSSNTGRLAIHSLNNSVMKIRGVENAPLEINELLTPEYDSLLLYPSEEAIPLTQDFLKSFNKPIQLIVPDGNWRQATKVNTRYPELAAVPRVKVANSNDDELFLRTESVENGMATLQAIAHALGTIEGAQVRDQLLDLYEEKLKRTLFARGLLPAHEFKDK